MRSVLIINSEIYEKYQKYEYFFNWFEDHGDVSVCLWNKYASNKADIDELVPQLFDVVKNLAEWNVYIVDEPFTSCNYIGKDFEDLTQYSINPYERNKGRAEYDPSEDTLMRLVYFLGGRGVEDLEYITNYAFRAVRPTQIFLLTPRIFENLEMQKFFLQSEIEEKNRKMSEDTSILLTESNTLFLQYSEFWGRYEYPSNCRFMVFDMPDTASVLYEDAWFSLWIATMTVILNSYNSSEIGPYKLYRLGIDISKESFTQFLNKYYGALHGQCEASKKEIDNEIRAIKAAMEDTTCNHPSVGAPVYVNFPDTDFSKFFPEKDDFGLTKDKPRLDTMVWNEHRDRSGVETHRLFKAITRGKNEAVDAMKRTYAVDLPLLKNQKLTRYDVEDIIDELNKSEIEMLELKTDRIASRTVFEKQERVAAKDVEKALPGRLMSKTYTALMLMGVLLCLAGFIPFIVSSAKFTFTSFMLSLFITGGSCFVVGLASYLALRGRRKKFDNTLTEYTDAVVSNMQNIKDNAQVQGKYLTSLLNYMEKYQLLKSGNVEEERMKNLEKLTQIYATYEDALEQCKSVAGICSVELSTDLPDEVADSMMFVRGSKIYLHDDTDSLFIPLNTEPNKLVPPFSFVQTLYIDEEALYESSMYFSVEGYDDLDLGVENIL